MNFEVSMFVARVMIFLSCRQLMYKHPITGKILVSNIPDYFCRV
ncbi:hypothetical protein MYAER_3339 [Microcystis aeruginosa NIES-2549]|uniref:Uncharacterized protein n=1 Tax=Microcystis aeruginosa NIES-2549 TaxID=1641812 RepID=A0A0F6U6Z3_MICAE|nr:hypothetical protein MYAER_3339 [Microcystis aeruginosa NIES-2549]AOC54081.1 hypothetical protein amyaer_3376 [Microcystis aeruginosa NIES-2481]